MPIPIRTLKPLASALLCAGLLGLAGTAGAGIITVDSLLDDGSPGNCELRDALELSNTGVGGDACTDSDTSAPNEIRFAVTGTIPLNNNTPLYIDADVTIAGPGPDNLTIDAQDNSRVFVITNSTVTLSGLSMLNGYAMLDSGGAVYFDGAADSLTIRDSQIAFSDTDEDGGAIFLYRANHFTLDNSIIRDNNAGGDGGGINVYDLYGDIRITRSTITNNDASYGGGIFIRSAHGNRDHLISHTWIDLNNAYDDGGGLFLHEVQGNLTITSSVISGNEADGRGGGIYSYDGAMGASVIVRDTTLSDNVAWGENGGGVYIHSENSNSFDFINSTITGNSAYGGLGGGVFADMEAHFVNSTVVDNFAYHGGGGVYAGYDVYLQNAIIAGNTGDGGDDDVYVEAGWTVQVASSLIESAPTGPGAVNGSYLSTDPGLDVLTYNGGPTVGASAQTGYTTPMPTHLPLAGSPVINAGDNTLAGSFNLTRDQRGNGYARVVGGTVDLGATEYGAAPGGPQPVPGPAAGALAWLSLLLGAAGLGRLRRRGTG